MEKTGLHAIMAKIVAKAWTDEEYAENLKNDPHRILQEEGVPISKTEGEIIVLFDDEKTRYLVIPEKPHNMSINEKEIILLASQRIDVQLELFGQ